MSHRNLFSTHKSQVKECTFYWWLFLIWWFLAAVKTGPYLNKSTLIVTRYLLFKPAALLIKNIQDWRCLGLITANRVAMTMSFCYNTWQIVGDESGAFNEWHEFLAIVFLFRKSFLIFNSRQERMIFSSIKYLTLLVFYLLRNRLPTCFKLQKTCKKIYLKIHIFQRFVQILLF